MCERDKLWHLEMWRNHSNDPEKVGLSQKEFCENHKLNWNTFRQWYFQYKQRGFKMAEPRAKKSKSEVPKRSQKQTTDSISISRTSKPFIPTTGEQTSLDDFSQMIRFESMKEYFIRTSSYWQKHFVKNEAILRRYELDRIGYIVAKREMDLGG